MQTSFPLPEEAVDGLPALRDVDARSQSYSWAYLDCVREDGSAALESGQTQAERDTELPSSDG